MCNIGRIIYGYCNGYFRDSYNNKRIEAEGIDWIVARDIENETAPPEFASFRNESVKKLWIEDWSNKEKVQNEK